jgi:hypothetical protein|tara:strand:- start:340 stop:522 length:183 start_codon:yes stop_codon:yes gene_type:complete
MTRRSDENNKNTTIFAETHNMQLRKNDEKKRQMKNLSKKRNSKKRGRTFLTLKHTRKKNG